MLIESEGRIFEYQHDAYVIIVNILGKTGKNTSNNKQIQSENCIFCKTDGSESNNLFKLIINGNSSEKLKSAVNKMWLLSRENNITDIAISKKEYGLEKLSSIEFLDLFELFIGDSSINLSIYSDS